MENLKQQVLLIGESEEMVALTGRMLERGGFFVRKAVGEYQAERELKKEFPGLIVMDCDLPDGNGFDICKKIKSIHRSVKIILTSNDEEDEIISFCAGADDFIKKPYRIEVLLARMRCLCKAISSEENQ